MTIGSIPTAVASALATSLPGIQEALVSRMVAATVSKRIDVLSDAFTKIEKMRSDLRKIDRPDMIQYGRDGKAIEGSQTFSKARADEIKKVEEQIGKWVAAFELAFDKDDWNKLNDLIGKGGNAAD